MDAPRNYPDVLHEYITNENPFAYMKDYLENPFLDPDIKLRLDALQQMQPKFIPLAITASILKTEQAAKAKAVVHLQIESLLDKGMALIGSTELSREDALRTRIDDPRILDILIDINRLRLLESQDRLREKVYYALKDVIPQDTAATIDCSLPVEENYLEDAIEYEALAKAPPQPEPQAPRED